MLWYHALYMKINSDELAGDWEQEGQRLRLSVELDDFMLCVDMINRIAAVAEEKDHHPNICLKDYKRLEIEIYTHSEDSLTQKDVDLAQALEVLFEPK